MTAICRAAHFGDTGLRCARLIGHRGPHACDAAGESVTYWTSRLSAPPSHWEPLVHPRRSGAWTAAAGGRPVRSSGR
jgi:hypothetical protein